MSSLLRDLTFTAAELRDKLLCGLFSSTAQLTLSMLCLFVSQLLPSTIILKIFSKCLARREQQKIDFKGALMQI